MNPLDEKTLGHRLQTARLAAGLTQQGLCQKANLSYSTLAKIERGAIKSPSIFTIENIAEALDITLDELLGRQPIKPAEKQRQRSRSGVRFVYFDVNGCLVRSYHRAFAKLGHDSGQPVDVVETLFWHYNDQVCLGEMTIEAFNLELAKQLHMSIVDWTTYYLAEVEPMPSMAEVVNWTSQHYGVGLMTNIMPGLLTEMRQRGIIPNIAYDSIIDSSEVHVIKPEAKMYQIAIERAAVKPAEILLVDDSRANIMAAEKSGLHVLWFDDSRPEELAERIKQTLEPATDGSQVSAPAEPEAIEAEAVSEELASLPFPPEPTPLQASLAPVQKNADIPGQW